MKISATTMEATATMETYGAVKSSAWLESMSIGFVEFAEAMAVAIATVSAIEKRGTINREGRVEAPAEWAIEIPIHRNEGAGAKPRIPVPASVVPTTATVDVQPCGIRAGLREISGTQPRPAIEVVGILPLVLALRFQLSPPPHRHPAPVTPPPLPHH